MYSPHINNLESPSKPQQYFQVLHHDVDLNSPTIPLLLIIHVKERQSLEKFTPLDQRLNSFLNVYYIILPLGCNPNIFQGQWDLKGSWALPSHQLVFLPISAGGPGESQGRMCIKWDIGKLIGAGGPADLDINPGLSVSLHSGNQNISFCFLNHSTKGRGKVRWVGLTEECFLKSCRSVGGLDTPGVCDCCGLYL